MGYVDKEHIEKLKHACIAKYPLSYINGIFAFAKEIAEMPEADVVEVVRCKVCKHRYSSEFCECRPEDAYCSDGERE